MDNVAIPLETGERSVIALTGPEPERRDQDDAALVEAAAAGDEPAFEALVARHRPAAFRVAVSIVGYDRAEDVVQDALLLAFRALSSIRDGERFPQWLATITRFRAMRFGRSEVRHTRSRIPLDEVFLETFAPPLRPTGRSLERGELLQALAKLPRPYGEVVRLHFLSDLPHEAISKLMGVPVSTVKWRCFRGKGLLRKQLGTAATAVAERDECGGCRPVGLRVECVRDAGKKSGAACGNGAEERRPRAARRAAAG